MKIIFWATDLQKDFMNKDGALYVQGAEAIKPILKEITEFAKEKGITVVNTGDYHTMTSEEISNKPDFKTTFPPHCLIDTKGVDFIEETNPRKGNEIYCEIYRVKINMNINQIRNIILDKDKFDIFEGNLYTDEILAELNPDLVVVYGVATNVCVNQAVLGLRKRGKEIIVITDAIKELPNLDVEAIYKVWKEHFIHCVTWEKAKDIINLSL